MSHANIIIGVDIRQEQDTSVVRSEPQRSRGPREGTRELTATAKDIWKLGFAYQSVERRIFLRDVSFWRRLVLACATTRPVREFFML